MSEPDFKGKRLSLTELRARREARERSGHNPLKRKRPRITQVASVSIPKHLKIRCELEIGEGSFSRGVVKAITRYLKEMDEEKELMRG